MKFMLNGAITLGTVDGANVEIAQRVGEDNIFTFGLKADEVEKVWQAGYNASHLYSSDAQIRRVVDALQDGLRRAVLFRHCRLSYAGDQLRCRPLYGAGRFQGLPACSVGP